MAQVTIEDFVPVKYDIGQAVSTALDAFSKERGRVEAAREADFQSAVASNTLSPDAQVSYRQQMLDNAKSAPVPDPDYITDLESKLATTKTMARIAKVTSKMNADRAAAMGGLESNQEYLEQLQSLLEGENDPSMQKSLQEEITNVNGEILSAKLALIQSEAAKGTTDKSTIELNKALDDAKTQKASALAAGDDARAASMDVVISAVNQQLVNIKIDTINNGLNINKSTQADPLGYLQKLQELVATSDATTPIEYQGVGSYRVIAYASEQAYWQSVLGNYLNTTFVKDLQSQYDNYVNNAAIVNKLIPSSVLDSVKNDFAQLSANPVLAPYATQLQQVSVQVLGAAVAKNAAAIVNDYKLDNDANKATAALNSLSSRYGVDVTSYSNEIVAGAAKQTTSEISAINSIASNYLMQNPSMGTAAAMSQALKDFQSGQGGAIPTSNKDLATKTPAQVLNPTKEQIDNTVNKPPLTEPIQNNQNPTPAQQGNEPTVSPLQNALKQNPSSSQPSGNQPSGSQPSGLQMPKFTSFVKTKNSPEVYGVDTNGKTVGFETLQEFYGAGGSENGIKLVNSAPTNVVKYSDYAASQQNNSNPNPTT